MVRRLAADICMRAVDVLLDVAERLAPLDKVRDTVEVFGRELDVDATPRTVELGAYFDVIDIGEVNVVVSRN